MGEAEDRKAAAAAEEAKRAAAQEAYKKEREELRAKASLHFDEMLDDTMRSMRRAKKHKGDFDMVDNNLRAARLSLKALEDANRRMR